MSIYKYDVEDNEGKCIKLEDYRGKVLLIVNTATGCGFTPQYKELQALYHKYADEGFEVLDFPCNQFGHQAPGSSQEISTFCELNYQTTFKQFKKIDVNGENELPLYAYLKKQKSGILGGNIKWNFTKFVVDREGNVVGRFAPTTKGPKMEKMIQELLKA